MLLVATHSRLVEAQLAAGELACPACGGHLSRSGFTAWRSVRDRDGARQVRLRRACCRAYEATHVLLPASLSPRRRDDVELIGAALALAARGLGHRPIAARLDRPPATVRGRLRPRAPTPNGCARARRGGGWRWTPSPPRSRQPDRHWATPSNWCCSPSAPGSCDSGLTTQQLSGTPLGRATRAPHSRRPRWSARAPRADLWSSTRSVAGPGSSRP